MNLEHDTIYTVFQNSIPVGKWIFIVKLPIVVYMPEGEIEHPLISNTEENIFETEKGELRKICVKAKDYSFVRFARGCSLPYKHATFRNFVTRYFGDSAFADACMGLRSVHRVRYNDRAFEELISKVENNHHEICRFGLFIASKVLKELPIDYVLKIARIAI